MQPTRGFLLGAVMVLFTLLAAHLVLDRPLRNWTSDAVSPPFLGTALLLIVAWTAAGCCTLFRGRLVLPRGAYVAVLVAEAVGAVGLGVMMVRAAFQPPTASTRPEELLLPLTAVLSFCVATRRYTIAALRLHSDPSPATKTYASWMLAQIVISVVWLAARLGVDRHNAPPTVGLAITIVCVAGLVIAQLRADAVQVASVGRRECGRVGRWDYTARSLTPIPAVPGTFSEGGREQAKASLVCLYYHGLDGPTIRMEAADTEPIRLLEGLFRSLARGETSAASAEQIPGVVLSGMAGLAFELRGGGRFDQSVFLLGEEASGPAFLWCQPRDAWDDTAEFVAALLDPPCRGHQFLSGGGGDDAALIVLSLREPRIPAGVAKAVAEWEALEDSETARS